MKEFWCSVTRTTTRLSLETSDYLFPGRGELVAVRVIRADPGRDDRIAEISGEPWAVARPGDQPDVAPEISRGKR